MKPIADKTRVLRPRDTQPGQRYRLESRSAEGYIPRAGGCEGWTRRDEFGTFGTLDDAYAAAFRESNNGSGQVFAVVPAHKEEAA